MDPLSTGASYEVSKLKAHCMAVRKNKDILAHVFMFLSEDPPNASAAQEAFEEIGFQDQIDLWSMSPTAGGIWETWEREAIKTGTLGRSYEIFKKF